MVAVTTLLLFFFGLIRNILMEDIRSDGGYLCTTSIAITTNQPSLRYPFDPDTFVESPLNSHFFTQSTEVPKKIIQANLRRNGRRGEDFHMNKYTNKATDFELHIVLIEEDIMLSENEDPLDRHGSSFATNNIRWLNGIVPYDLNATEYTLLDLYTIRDGMKEIEKDTCIKFVPRVNHTDFIYITPHGGCWSYLGRKGSGQTLSLSVPVCMNRGTVIHELIHALGFWHEHSRPDRDDHVDVLWDNIVSVEKQSNFAIHPSIWKGATSFPYDYMSVMHYSAYAFSKSPNLPTIVPMNFRIRLKELGRAKTVGTLTNIDKLKINAFYECPSA